MGPARTRIRRSERACKRVHHTLQRHLYLLCISARPDAAAAVSSMSRRSAGPAGRPESAERQQASALIAQLAAQREAREARLAAAAAARAAAVAQASAVALPGDDNAGSSSDSDDDAAAGAAADDGLGELTARMRGVGLADARAGGSSNASARPAAPAPVPAAGEVLDLTGNSNSDESSSGDGAGDEDGAADSDSDDEPVCIPRSSRPASAPAAGGDSSGDGVSSSAAAAAPPGAPEAAGGDGDSQALVLEGGFRLAGPIACKLYAHQLEGVKWLWSLHRLGAVGRQRGVHACMQHCSRMHAARRACASALTCAVAAAAPWCAHTPNALTWTASDLRMRKGGAPCANTRSRVRRPRDRPAMQPQSLLALACNSCSPHAHAQAFWLTTWGLARRCR